MSMSARERELTSTIDATKAEMQRIHDAAPDRALNGGEKTRWDSLKAKLAGAEAERAELRANDTAARNRVLEAGTRNGQPGDAGARDAAFQIQRRTDPGPSDFYERARVNIDTAAGAGQLPDHAADKATGLLENGSETERSIAARWAAAAGDPAYRTAFAQLLADPERGHLLWTPEEADAYRRVASVGNLMRSMSTTGNAGGYMIPLTLDPAIMLTSDGSNNPLRRLARVVQTATNAWQGVTSAGATSEWKAEAVEVADGSPTLANPSIPVFFGDAFVPYSFEVGMDAENFLGELTKVLVDSADNLQAAAYTTGNGTTAPQGIVTGLVGTASEINGGGTEAIIAADAVTLQNALPARFSGNASWLGHIATLNTFAAFETTNGALRYPSLQDNPPRLLTKPWYEVSNMDGSINAAATANNYVLIYGDVRAGFIIVDRIGSTIELIPHLMGANRRPTGERGALLWFRTGSEVVVPQALRLLDIPTTA